jgi:hypothetical protein
MANTSKISGFRPVKHINGSPYNGQANIYFIPATDGTAVYVGDLVKLAGSGDTVGTATVALAAAGDAVIGSVVGIVNTKLDPVTGKLSSGSISLDTPQYRAASTATYVLVADSTDIVYEAEAANGTPAATDLGLNINHAVGTPSTTTGASGAYLDFGTEATTATLTLKLLGFVNRPDNEIGASAKMLVKINNHQFNSGTGTAGV